MAEMSVFRDKKTGHPTIRIVRFDRALGRERTHTFILSEGQALQLGADLTKVALGTDSQCIS